MGSGSTTTQEAVIPDELQPLFEALALGNITQIPQATGLISAIQEGQAQPRLSAVQQLAGDLLAQRIATNPLLRGLPAASGLAQGLPRTPQRSLNIPESPFDLNEAFVGLLESLTAKDDPELQALFAEQGAAGTSSPARPAPTPTATPAGAPEKLRLAQVTGMKPAELEKKLQSFGPNKQITEAQKLLLIEQAFGDPGA